MLGSEINDVRESIGLSKVQWQKLTGCTMTTVGRCSAGSEHNIKDVSTLRIVTVIKEAAPTERDRKRLADVMPGWIERRVGYALARLFACAFLDGDMYPDGDDPVPVRTKPAAPAKAKAAKKATPKKKVTPKAEKAAKKKANKQVKAKSAKKATPTPTPKATPKAKTTQTAPAVVTSPEVAPEAVAVPAEPPAEAVNE